MKLLLLLILLILAGCSESKRLPSKKIHPIGKSGWNWTI